MVRIDHGGGIQTVYCHMIGQPPVTYGQVVTQGQVIGYVGTSGNSTGYHLHYEARVNGQYTDPTPYLSYDEPISQPPGSVNYSADYAMPYLYKGGLNILSFMSNKSGEFVSAAESPLLKDFGFERDKEDRGQGMFGDITGDGKAEYVMPYADERGFNLIAFTPNENGQFVPLKNTTFPTLGFPKDSNERGQGVLADIDGDGKMDYALAYKEGNELKIISFLSDGNGSFSAEGSPKVAGFGFSQDDNNRGQGMFGDITGYGRADYVMPYANEKGFNLITFTPDENGHYAPLKNTTFPILGFPRDLNGRGQGVLADIDGDGKMDYVIAYKEGKELKIISFLSDGNGGFSADGNLKVAGFGFSQDDNNRGQGMFGDITGDGRADYVMPYADERGFNLITFTPDENGQFAPLYNTTFPELGFPRDSNGRGQGVLADIDGDGKMDYALPYGDENGNQLRIVSFISNGYGQFSAFGNPNIINFGFGHDAKKRGNGTFINIDNY